jgi:predicted RNA binding protein YcfA (HicA-like mRNA interferase family)
LKRRDLIKKIEAQGGVLIRHGGKHDWYQNPVNVSRRLWMNST